MGADNWARCPKCDKEREEFLAAQSVKVDEAYGKVPVDKFDQMRAQLKELRSDLELDKHRTFREDYEFAGAETGVVNVSYRGQCTKCGLKLKFSEDHQIPGL